MQTMKTGWILSMFMAGAFLLTGCAEDRNPAPFNGQAVSSRTPESGDSANPPVTLSGYVDTSTTMQTK